MKGFDLANILSNPNFIAGMKTLAPIGGQGLVDAELLKRQQQTHQMGQQEHEVKLQEALRKQQAAQMLPQLIQEGVLNPADLNGSLQNLIARKVDPDAAMALIGALGTLQNQQASQGIAQETLGLNKERLGLERQELGTKQQKAALEMQKLQKELAGETDPGERRKIEGDLRNEIQQSPIHKEFTKIKTTYNTIKELVGKPNPSGFDDNSALVLYVKMNDPTSVVSPGEAVTAKNSPGLPQQLLGQIQSWQSNGSLIPSARKQLLSSAKTSYTEHAKAYKSYIEPYKELAKGEKARPEKVILHEPAEEDSDINDFQSDQSTGFDRTQNTEHPSQEPWTHSFSNDEAERTLKAKKADKERQGALGSGYQGL